MKVSTFVLSVACVISIIQAERHPEMAFIENNHGINWFGCILDQYHILTTKGNFSPGAAAKVHAGSDHIVRGKGHSVASYTSHGNLSILKLAEPIKLDDKTTKAVKMFEAGEKIEPGTGRGAAVVGWGSSWREKLRKYEYKVVDYQDCVEVYHREARHSICIQSLGHCPGGFGSALFVDGKLAGIENTQSCSYPNLPAFFTEISQVRDWIRRIIGH